MKAVSIMDADILHEENGVFVTRDGLRVSPFGFHEWKRGEHRKPFTDEQIVWMRNWLGILTNRECELIMGVGYKTIQSIRKQLGIKSCRKRAAHPELVEQCSKVQMPQSSNVQDVQEVPNVEEVKKPKRKYVRKPKPTVETDEQREAKLQKRYANFKDWNKAKDKPKQKKALCIDNCWCKTHKLCFVKTGEECRFDLENKFWIKNK